MALSTNCTSCFRRLQHFGGLLVLLAAAGCAAGRRPALPRDLVTGVVSYRRVVVAEGFSREQLYDRARAWLQLTYHLPAGTPAVEDKDTWTIVAQGADTVVLQGRAPAVVRHTLSFSFREGRFQYEFTNFSAAPFGPFENDTPPGTRRGWNQLRATADAQVKTRVSSLERAMTDRPKGTRDF